LGLPGETRQTILKSINFAKSLPLDDISVFSCTPFPGTELYESWRDFGIMEGKGEQMNVLTPVFAHHGLILE